MRYMLIALLVLAGCGGSATVLPNECDPCPMDNGSVSGDTASCSCVTGKGAQDYPRVLQGTTFCAQQQAAWNAYATINCVPIKG